MSSDMDNNFSERRYPVSPRSHIPPAPGPDCPDFATWGLFEARLLPEARVAELLEHGASCSACGALLADMHAEEVPTDPSGLHLQSNTEAWQKDMLARLENLQAPTDLPGHASTVRVVPIRPAGPEPHGLPVWFAAAGALPTDPPGLPLTSNTEAWQKDMLAQLGSSDVPGVSPGKVSTVHVMPSRTAIPARHRLPAWFAVAAMFCLSALAAAWWFYRTNSPEAAFGLLARAYSEQRPLEFRIAGAEHSPLAVQRGTTPVAPSASFASAQALILRKLETSSEATPWLRARARADLLQWRYAPALDTLLRAQRAEPDNPEIDGDLGIAYLERNAAEAHPEDLLRAVEHLTTALRRRPADPVFLFNRALAWEQLSLPNDATKDWRELLKLEPSGGWATEAKAHLARLEEILRRQARWGAAPPTDPNSLATLEPGEPPVFDLLRTTYLDPAATSSETLHALATAFSTRHGDLWLRDFLQNAPPDTRPAIQALIEAEASNRKGDPASAARHAEIARAAFQKSGHHAGALRARYELLYAYQRSSRARECLAAGPELSADLQTRPYPWLRTQTLLERSGCASMTGDFAVAATGIQASVRDAQAHNLPNLAMRGLGFHAAAFASRGDLAGALTVDLQGLKTFWSQTSPPARAYQFFYTLSVLAQQHDYPWSAQAFSRESVAQISRTQNLTTEAMARTRLGNLHLAVANTPAARTEFARAEQLFSQTSASAPGTLYRADGQIGLALVEAREANPAAALRRLASLEAGISNVANQNVTLSFFRADAEIQQRAGNIAAAEQAARALATIAETGLNSLAASADRLTWLHDLDAAYRGLVDSRLRQNDPAGALDAWEWYCAADNRSHNAPSPAIAAQPRDIATLRAAPSPFPVHWVDAPSRLLTHSTLLTYVQLDDYIAAWRLDNRGLVYRKISLSRRQANRLADRFLEACANPASSLAALRTDGNTLYSTLLAPFSPSSPDGLDAHRTLVINADGPVARIPFEALLTPDGAWLGQTRAIVVSPGLAHFQDAQPPAALSGILAVGAPLLSPNLAQTLPPLREALDEATAIAGLFPAQVLLTGAQATRSALLRELDTAAVFHFAGHAVNSAERTALLLAGDDQTPDSGVLSADMLRGVRLKTCRLAVLSACSTSPMSGWGISEPGSLARSLLAAGVSNVVASRWPVDSAATRRLMLAFYSGLRQGDSPPIAMRTARNTLWQGNNAAHPYYWAAFSTFGNL